MKKTTRIAALLAAAALIFGGLFFSCSDEEDNNTPKIEVKPKSSHTPDPNVGDNDTSKIEVKPETSHTPDPNVGDNDTSKIEVEAGDFFVSADKKIYIEIKDGSKIGVFQWNGKDYILYYNSEASYVISDNMITLTWEIEGRHETVDGTITGTADTTSIKLGSDTLTKGEKPSEPAPAGSNVAVKVGDVFVSADKKMYIEIKDSSKIDLFGWNEKKRGYDKSEAGYTISDNTITATTEINGQTITATGTITRTADKPSINIDLSNFKMGTIMVTKGPKPTKPDTDQN